MQLMLLLHFGMLLVDVIAVCSHNRSYLSLVARIWMLAGEGGYGIACAITGKKGDAGGPQGPCAGL